MVKYERDASSHACARTDRGIAAHLQTNVMLVLLVWVQHNQPTATQPKHTLVRVL